MSNLIQSVSKIFKDNKKIKTEPQRVKSKFYINQTASTTQKSSQSKLLRKLTTSDISGPSVSSALIDRTYDILQKSCSNLNAEPSERKLKRKKIKRSIFGVALNQMELCRTKQPNVPRFVVDLVSYIELKFIKNEGLYRTSGNVTEIKTLKQELKECYDKKLFETVDANVLTSLLKLFFRELPDSLIPQKVFEIFINKNNAEEVYLERLHNLFMKLPNPRRSTIKFLIKHFMHVASLSLENRMTAYNIATVWGPTIVWVENLNDIKYTVLLVKTLILNYDEIFNAKEHRC